MQPLTNDATTALLRAIREKFRGGGELVFEDIRSRAWASVTFSGARHELTMLVTGAEATGAAARFAGTLDEAEFRLRGHILADIALVSSEAMAEGVRLRIEALTVED